MRTELVVERFSQDMRLLEPRSQPSRSWVLNFIKLLYMMHSTESYSIQPVMGGEQTMYAHERVLQASARPRQAYEQLKRPWNKMADVIGEEIGIQVGTGNTPVNGNDVHLAERINPTHGRVCWYFYHPDYHSASGLTWDGTCLRVSAYREGTSQYEILQIDPLDGSIISSIVPPVNTYGGLTWDGAALWWSCDSDDTIYQLNPSTGAVLNSWPSPAVNPRDLAWDGTYIWVCCAESGNERAYQCVAATGAVNSSVPLPTTSPWGLTWHNGYLWLMEGVYSSPKIFRLDPATGNILEQFIAICSQSSSNYPRGLTFQPVGVSGYLWFAERNSYSAYFWKHTGPNLDFQYAGCEVVDFAIGAADAQFNIRRFFTNKMGQSVIIREVGIDMPAYHPDSYGNYYLYPCLVCRDVLVSPVTVADGELLKVTYSIQITV